MILKPKGVWTTIAFTNGTTLEVEVNANLRMNNSEELGLRFKRMADAQKQLEKLEKRRDELVGRDDFTPEEYSKLEAEIKKWQSIGQPLDAMREIARRAIISWKLYTDEESEARDERLPFNNETLDMLEDDKLVELGTGLSDYYNLSGKEGNASGGNLPADSQTLKEQKAVSPTGTATTSLPESTALEAPAA